MSYMEHLAKLKAIRIEKRITSVDMCKELKISRAMLWRYETGRVSIPFDIFERYCLELGFEIKLMIK